MTVAAHPKQVQGETHQHAGMGHARNGSRFSAGKSATALVWAAYESHTETIKVLIAAGKGYTEIVDILKQAGAR